MDGAGVDFVDVGWADEGEALPGADWAGVGAAVVDWADPGAPDSVDRADAAVGALSGDLAGVDEPVPGVDVGLADEVPVDGVFAADGVGWAAPVAGDVEVADVAVGGVLRAATFLAEADIADTALEATVLADDIADAALVTRVLGDAASPAAFAAEDDVVAASAAAFFVGAAAAF